MNLAGTSTYGRAALDSLRSTSAVFSRIQSGENLTAMTTQSLSVAALGSAFFGLALGTYADTVAQALSSAIKVPLLLLVTALLCFPTFHIFQSWRAPTPLGLGQAIAVQTTALAAAGLVWASLSPPVFFLIRSTHDYRLAQLFALVVGATGGAVGLLRLLSGYSTLCLEGRRGPRLFLLIYFVAFAVVGCQLAWELRPFVGSPTLPFQLFRPYDPEAGNVFTTVLGIGG